MSKKCCGITYTDDETVCKICGKPLVEDIQDEEYKRMLEETNKVVEDVLRMQKEAENASPDKADAPPESEFSVTVDENNEAVEDIEATEITDDGKVAGNNEITDNAKIADDADNKETTDDVKAIYNNESVDASDTAEITDAAEVNDYTEEVDDEEITDNEDTDDLEEDDGKKKISADRAGGGTKAFGIISLIVAVLGLAFVTLCVIFLIVFPIYDKSDMEGKNLEYPEIATSADATQQRALLTPTDIELDTFFDDTTATATDAGQAADDTTETADTTEQAE